MKTPKKNPIAISVLPLAGRQMPSDWKIQTNDFGGNFDRRNFSEMWRNPEWSSKFNDGVENLTQNARLKPFNNNPGK